MSDLTNPRFWRAYGRFGAILTLGLALAVLLGIPTELAIRLLAGAMMSFPVAYKSILRAGTGENPN